MREPNIHTFESEDLSDVQKDGRLVLYEEIAEYFYLYSRKDALNSSSVNSEINYHIGNMVLLTLYFDAVLIQTSSIFNSVDPFVRKVAKGVLNHRTFREMLDSNVVKIVGWGGSNSKEMFQAAKEFSIVSNPSAVDAQYLSVVASVFNSQSTVTRSEMIPDDEITALFKKRLEQTTIIRRENEYREVEEALDKSLEKTGQLVAVSFNPEIGKLKLSTASATAVGTSFIQSWHDHLANEMPGVAVYAPLSNPTYIGQQVVIEENEVRTFLYSPQIFASFLSGYLQPVDFNKILKRPYSELIKVRNGDWKRFSDAYHEAIHTVSKNIGHLDHSEITSGEFSNKGQWSASLEAAVARDANQVDINAFVESLAMLSGVVLTVPFLGPLFKTAGLLVGKKVNETFNSLQGNATSEVSPFIQKLMRHYELTGNRA